MIDKFRALATEDRATALLADSLCPWISANFLEAYSEIDIVGDKGLTLQQLCTALSRADYETIGRIIGHQIFGYWAEKAAEQADRETGYLF